MIHHRPHFDRKKVIALYEEKDGVPIKYVCTSALGSEERSRDIFYRETPHPEFGNHYFGLFWAYPMVGEPQLMISNCDAIEDELFEMIEGGDGLFHYSQHRHDFYDVPGTGCAIDGGRAYLRRVGNVDQKVTSFRIEHGEFVGDAE